MGERDRTEISERNRKADFQDFRLEMHREMQAAGWRSALLWRVLYPTLYSVLYSPLYQAPWNANGKAHIRDARSPFAHAGRQTM